MMIQLVWQRIKDHEGEIFYQKRGGEFTYTVKGNTLHLSRTNRSVSRPTFEKALRYVPLENTVPIQKLQAPSYLYAILMDKRIKMSDW